MDMANGRSYQFSYLADAFLYDSETDIWKVIHTDKWPTHRAQGVIVAVPNNTPADDAGASAGKGTAPPPAGKDAGTLAGKGAAALAGSAPAGNEPGCSTEAMGCGHAGASGSCAKKNRMNEGSRLLALGGYACDSQVRNMPFSEVWELTLGTSKQLKHVHTVCWSCGKVEQGLTLCQGTCGGAVAVCGGECREKVWQEGHRRWCKKKGS